MKKDASFLCAVLTAALLAAVLVLSGCPGDPDTNSELREPFSITFDLGYEGAPSVFSITVQGGEVSGSKWPVSPKRLGWVFDGWFDGSVLYTAQTTINKDVTVTAKWNPESSGEEQPSAAELETLFNTELPTDLSNSWKIWGHHNALITQGFGADPTAFEYNGRLYLFASNDTLLYTENKEVTQGGYNAGIQGLRAISSADLVNWTDHGVINVAGPVSTNPLIPVSQTVIYPGTYAVASWAPSAAWRMSGGKPRFYIYYANSGNGIGVITADSPTGPWRSPLNRLLISRDTPNCETVANLFDPGVMVDDDGQAYLFFGGGNNSGEFTGQGRRVSLGFDMISINGIPEIFDPPFLFEDSEIVKIDGRYYYSYVTNQSANKYGLKSSQIAYMTADYPMGNFSEPKGIMEIASTQLGSNDNNNHHCIFRFRDSYYIAYHAAKVRQAMGITTAISTSGYYRSTHIDKVTVNPDGSIATVTMTRKGVEQVGKFNPYLPNEAESIGIMGGVFTRADDEAGNGMVVTSIDSGDWVGVYGVDFGSDGANKFLARVRTPVAPADYTGGIELRLDPVGDGITGDDANLDATATTRIKGGRVIGRLQIKARPGEEGKYATIAIDLDETVTGEHNLVFVFYSSLGVKPITLANMWDSHHKNGFEFDQWQFLP